MPVTEELVREQLKKVIDPELFVNIVDLGLIYVVELEPSSAAAPDDEAAPEAASQGDSAASGDAAEAANDEAAASEVGVTNVKIDMTMTSPMCPAGPQLVANSKQAVGQLEGIGDVEVRVVMDPPWTPDMMTDDAKDQLGIF